MFDRDIHYILSYREVSKILDGNFDFVWSFFLYLLKKIRTSGYGNDIAVLFDEEVRDRKSDASWKSKRTPSNERSQIYATLV